MTEVPTANRNGIIGKVVVHGWSPKCLFHIGKTMKRATKARGKINPNSNKGGDNEDKGIPNQGIDATTLHSNIAANVPTTLFV